MSNILSIIFDNAADVTKSDDTADPAGPFAALLCSAGGSLKLTTVRGGTVALIVVAGQVVPIATQRVWSTGSAASVTGLLALPFRGPSAAVSP